MSQNDDSVGNDQTQPGSRFGFKGLGAAVKRAFGSKKSRVSPTKHRHPIPR